MLRYAPPPPLTKWCMARPVGVEVPAEPPDRVDGDEDGGERQACLDPPPDGVTERRPRQDQPDR